MSQCLNGNNGNANHCSHCGRDVPSLPFGDSNNPEWVCQECFDIEVEMLDDDNSENRDYVTCSNCGASVACEEVDDDDCCPECGANIYSLGY